MQGRSFHVSKKKCMSNNFFGFKVYSNHDRPKDVLYTRNHAYFVFTSVDLSLNVLFRVNGCRVK